MNSKKILFLALAAALVSPFVASASTIPSIAAQIISNAYTIGTVIVVIGWIITGFLFLTSGGEPSKLNLAKTALVTMIAGTIVLYIIVMTGYNGAFSFTRSSFGL